MKTSRWFVLAWMFAVPAGFVACSGSSSTGQPSGKSHHADGSAQGDSKEEGGGHHTDADKHHDARATEASESSRDAPVADDAPSSCREAVLVGPDVTTLVQEGEEPPPSGGPLVEGTYVLRRIYLYAGTGEGGTGNMQLEERKTLVLSAGGYGLAQAVGTISGGTRPDPVTGGAYVPSGKNITLVQQCPPMEAGASPMSIGYSAAGDGIELYFGPYRVEFYSSM